MLRVDGVAWGHYYYIIIIIIIIYSFNTTATAGKSMTPGLRARIISNFLSPMGDLVKQR